MRLKDLFLLHKIRASLHVTTKLISCIIVRTKNVGSVTNILNTVTHILGGSILIPTEYKSGHDRLGQYLLWKICPHYQIKIAANYYKHHEESFVREADITVLWVSFHQHRLNNRSKSLGHYYQR